MIFRMDLTFQISKSLPRDRRSFCYSGTLAYYSYEYVNLSLIPHIYYAYCQSLTEVEVCVSAKKKRKKRKGYCYTSKAVWRLQTIHCKKKKNLPICPVKSHLKMCGLIDNLIAILLLYSTKLIVENWSGYVWHCYEYICPCGPDSLLMYNWHSKTQHGKHTPERTIMSTTLGSLGIESGLYSNNL